MRTKLFLIGAMAVMLVFFAVFAFVSGRQGGGACVKIITKIEDGDVSGSYALLSANAQQATSDDAWKQTVSSLSSFYDDVKPVQKTRVQETSTITGELQYKETYLIDTTAGNYTATCYASGDGREVNGFMSQLN